MSIFEQAQRDPEVRRRLHEVQEHYPDFYRMHPAAQAHAWRTAPGTPVA